MTDEIRNWFLFINIGVIFAMAWAYWVLDRQRLADWLKWSKAYADLSERLAAALAELDGLRGEREGLVRRAEWMARELRSDERHQTEVWSKRKPTVWHVVGLVLALVGCGSSPADADAELTRSAQHPEEWCGWEHGHAVEKSIPDDYGNTASPGGCNSTGLWPGGYCWVPANTNITWQNTLNSGISSWNLAQTGALNAWESQVDPLSGWEITQVGSGGNFESYVGTTHPGGFLGSANMFSYFAVSTAQGEMRLYEYCSAVIYKTHIEVNSAYQAASAGQRSKYIRNLHRHEMGHCLGLMHQTTTPNTLMSVNYNFPGAWFDSHLAPTAAELARIDAWVP